MRYIEAGTHLAALTGGQLLRKSSSTIRLLGAMVRSCRTGTNNKHRSIFAFFSHVYLHHTPAIGLETGVRAVNSLINS